MGPDATLFRPGDEVYYAGRIQRPGANAQVHLVDERIVGHKPRRLDFPAAAAWPLTTLTAWESLFDRLGIARDGADRGKAILMIGAAGGVGSIAIQLARHLAGLRVIGTASRPQSAQWIRDLGAELAIDHRRAMPEQLRAAGLDGVDYVLCLTDATEYFPSFAELIRPQGKICLIVSMTAPVQLTTLMAKSVTVVWELMFTRSMFGTPDMQRQHDILEEVGELIDSGAIKTTLSGDLGAINAANLRRAHALLEEGRTIGKVVLSGFD
jgi:alcohol dehydrogenase